MLTLNDENFDNTIDFQGTILVDFWAEWCGPCKIMLPILEEIDSDGLVLVGKLNVDENPGKTEEYSVQSIPTMVLFTNGKPVHKVIGAMPKHKLLEELKQWI
jgi:thioredoxin 1